jgi:hypothetical protein
VVAAGHGLKEVYLPHYSAPMAAAMALVAVQGLRAVALRPPRGLPQAWVLAPAALLLQCVTFAIQVPALRDHPAEPIVSQRAVRDDLLGRGGSHLVLVKVSEFEILNGRDLAAPLLWAADRGEDDLRGLRELFPDRQVWRLVRGEQRDVLVPVAADR